MKYTILEQGENYAIKIDGVKPIIIPDRSGPIISNFSEVLVIPMKVQDHEPSENFIAINKKGEVIWKFNEDNYLEVKNRFVYLFQDNKEELWFKNLAGKEYKIDYKTGKVLKTRYENMDFDYKDNVVRIGKKDIKLEIPEGDGGKVVINQVFSWRGEVLFALYKNIKANISFERYPRTEHHELSENIFRELCNKFERRGAEKKGSYNDVKDWNKIQDYIFDQTGKQTHRSRKKKWFGLFYEKLEIWLLRKAIKSIISSRNNESNNS